MAKHSKVLNADDSIVETRGFPDAFDPATTAHKFGPEHSHRLIPHADVAAPPFDPATERLQSTTTVLPDRVENSFEVVAKTQAELDADAAEEDRTVKREQVRSVIQAMDDGTGTATERIVRVEKALVWIIRQHIED